jgi:hypothetical protein
MNSDVWSNEVYPENNQKCYILRRKATYFQWLIELHSAQLSKPLVSKPDLK